ncbi:hypothetical protein LUZ60_008247 [Juncus effusus]|nr:hypothetical protein LUZ60_008247 [Juncus effusus]
MATMGGARRALMVLRSSSSSSSRSFSKGLFSSSSSTARSFSRVCRPKLRSSVCRAPVELSCVESLMPLHSITASVLLTSMLSQKPGTWAWLSEGLGSTL